MDDRDKLKKIALFALAGIVILFVIMISIAVPLILMIKLVFGLYFSMPFLLERFWECMFIMRSLINVS